MLTVASLPWFALLGLGIAGVVILAVRLARERGSLLDRVARGWLVLTVGVIAVWFFVAVLTAVFTPAGQL